MKVHRVKDSNSLLVKAAAQDRVAEMAAETAREAERTGQTDSAQALWMVALRCRVHALKLRAEAEAHMRRR
jgi:hypothetical protein